MAENALSVALPTSTFLPSIGGVEVGLHRIAQGLLDRGHRPVVIAPRQHAQRLRDEGWTLPYLVETFPPKVFGILRHWPWLGFQILDRFFEHVNTRHNIDVWHATMGFPIGVPLVHYACSKGQTPHLIRCAGEDIQVNFDIGYGMRLDAKVDTLMRNWLPKAQSMISISQSVHEEYRSIGIQDERITYIPNGVDLERFTKVGDRESTRRSLGIGPNGFVFLSVGRNHPKKNYSILIEVAKILKTDEHECCFVIVGEGCEVLQQAADANGVGSMFVTHPGVSAGELPRTATPALPAMELIDLYQAVDAFAFPSKMETFGIVLVEAMAAGLPIVTTDAPGCRDIVRNGQDGIMVSPDNPRDIADALIEVMQSPALQNDLSQKAIKRAEDFSWDNVIESYVAHYRSLIADA